MFGDIKSISPEEVEANTKTCLSKKVNWHAEPDLTCRLSKLKPRALEKLRGFITNNEDSFSFFGNRPPIPGMGNTIFSENRTPENAQTFVFALHQFSAKKQVICGRDDLFFLLTWL